MIDETLNAYNVLMNIFQKKKSILDQKVVEDGWMLQMGEKHTSRANTNKDYYF